MNQGRHGTREITALLNIKNYCRTAGLIFYSCEIIKDPKAPFLIPHIDLVGQLNPILIDKTLVNTIRKATNQAQLATWFNIAMMMLLVYLQSGLQIHP